ncbi:hypothetical protein AAIB46_10295 [Streptomyces sp. 35M1]|uniref:hypothetical protein n=1 Tax=Streptomyces sp. 35M1 TaxID=3142978 RepID=UPI003990AE6B
MPEPIAFPDSVEVYARYLREALAARGDPVQTGTRVPTPRPRRFVTVHRIGGTRLDVVTDRPRLDVHCWGATEDEAADLVTVVRALAFAAPGWRGAVVYDVAEVGGPSLLTDSETSLPKYAHAIELSIRGALLI